MSTEITRRKATKDALSSIYDLPLRIGIGRYNVGFGISYEPPKNFEQKFLDNTLDLGSLSFNLSLLTLKNPQHSP